MAKKEEFIIVKTEEVDLNFYAVRSQDGKWLRKKGYMGGGQSWVTDITEARIYGKIGTAKRQVTFWANNYPEFGIPFLVRITTGKCEYLDQTERVKEVQNKKKLSEATRKFNRIQSRINDYVARNEREREQIKKWKQELYDAHMVLGKLKAKI